MNLGSFLVVPLASLQQMWHGSGAPPHTYPPQLCKAGMLLTIQVVIHALVYLLL